MQNRSRGLRGGALQIERQQPRQNLLVAHVVRPAVGSQHRLVQLTPEPPPDR